MKLERDTKRTMIRRISEARKKLIQTHPFYGILAMRLAIGLVEDDEDSQKRNVCKTAFTDMKHLVFHPGFLNELDEKELLFVIEHEVLHCVLQHCIRGKGKDPYLFNIAADYVVNSNILLGMGEREMQIAGCEVFHRLPNGHEAYEYTAEQVYDMLAEKSKDKTDMNCFGTCIDNHDYWEAAAEDVYASDVWKRVLEQMIEEGVSSHFPGGSVPPAIRQIEADYRHRKSVEWRVLLRDFISRCEGDEDYNFLPPERRFACMDFDVFLPGLNPVDIEVAEDIWFLADTSGSINNKTLKMIFSEIQYALEQVKGLKGKLSFFDTSVTAPRDFCDVKSLFAIRPTGGGGTSFYCIFRYLKEHMMNKPPKAIIILTDGYAAFPKNASIANGIPVIWMIVGSQVQAPWGKCIQINS